MSSAAVTSLGTLKERKRLVDDVWLLTLAILLVSVGVLWFQRMLDVSVAPVGWGAFAYGCVYLVVSAVADRIESRRGFVVLTAGLNLCGVVVLGLLWRLTGGLQNPLGLLVFVIPVLTASVLVSHWHGYLTAAVAVALVSLVSLVDNPALRWYVGQFGLPVDTAMSWTSAWATTPIRPFPGVVEPPPYLAVAVFFFAALLFAVASASGLVGHVLATLQTRVSTLSHALNQANAVSTDVIRQVPWPTVLVACESGCVASASRSFVERFDLDPETVLGCELLSLVQFSYPDAVSALIGGRDGGLDVAVCRVRGETRLLRVQVHHLEADGQRQACVSLLDVTEPECVRRGVDAIATPLVVVDTNGRVRSCNPAAIALFPELEPGIEASSALRVPQLPVDWWRLGRRIRQERELRRAEDVVAATCVAVPIDGEREPATAITFRTRAGAA